MKKYLIVWLIGFIVISSIGITLIVKANGIDVPPLGDPNWYEASTAHDKTLQGGISCLAFGNILYAMIIFIVFNISLRFNPKLRAQVTKKMTKIERDYQKEVDDETYEQMQDASSWHVGVHDKSIQRVASNINNKEVIKIKCPSCGTLNDEEATYSNKCGNKL